MRVVTTRNRIVRWLLCVLPIVQIVSCFGGTTLRIDNLIFQTAGFIVAVNSFPHGHGSEYSPVLEDATPLTNHDLQKHIGDISKIKQSVPPRNKTRAGRTVLQGEMSMNVFRSCLSRVMCGMDTEGAQKTKISKEYAKAVKKIIEKAILGTQSEEDDSESSEEDDDDDKTNKPKTPTQTTKVNPAKTKKGTTYRVIKPRYKTLEDVLEEPDDVIFKRRQSKDMKLPIFLNSTGNITSPRQTEQNRTGRVLKGILRTSAFRKFLYGKDYLKAIHPQMHQMEEKIMVSPEVMEKIMNPRQCRGRNLKVNWIRHNHPPQPTPVGGVAGASGTQNGRGPGNANACPFSFMELQQMLLESVGVLAMAAGGIGEQLGSIRPPEQGSKNKPNPQTSSLGGQNATIVDAKSPQTPNTLYAHFKLPVTISSSESSPDVTYRNPAASIGNLKSPASGSGSYSIPIKQSLSTNSNKKVFRQFNYGLKRQGNNRNDIQLPQRFHPSKTVSKDERRKEKRVRTNRREKIGSDNPLIRRPKQNPKKQVTVGVIAPNSVLDSLNWATNIVSSIGDALLRKSTGSNPRINLVLTKPSLQRLLSKMSMRWRTRNPFGSKTGK